MAYNEDLADRVREQLGSVKRVTEREMFAQNVRKPLQD